MRMPFKTLQLIAFGFLATAGPSSAQAVPQAPAPPDQAQLLKSSEAFIRNLFTWGSEFKVNVGPLTPSPSSDFYTVPLEVTMNGQTDKGTVYVSKDGKTFLRGEMFNMAADPFADTRSKLNAEGSPTQGPANAKVTFFAFSDFECPHCQLLHNMMKEIVPKYPRVRFVYKDFPLIQIHPWAETAAIGARCAFQQSPATYWKVSDAIFASQDLISASNIWDKLLDFASAANLDSDSFKACMASPEAKEAIDESHKQGEALGINGTPAVYVNGRVVTNVTTESIDQFLDFELAAQKK
jgi:protein-disulfide isomerase